MASIDYKNIRRTLSDLEINNDAYHVKFDMSPTNVNSIKEENGTRYFDLKVKVDVLVKLTGESLSFVADLLKIPNPGGSGFIVKGKSKQIVDAYTMSYGWYIMEKTKSIGVDHLKLLSERGMRLIIYSKNFKLYVTSGKKVSKSSSNSRSSKDNVPVAVLLKALTGESFSSLARRLAPGSIYSTASFASDEEPSRPECIDLVMRNLLKDYVEGGKKDYEFSQLSGEEKFNRICDRFFEGKMLYLGNTAGARLAGSISFQNRCKNTYLEEDISCNGYTFTKGIPLDARTLHTMDYLPIDSIKVSDINRKIYTIRKTSIHNFRCLGTILNKEVVLGDKRYEVGTPLDLDTLKDLGRTSVRELHVIRDGVSEVVKREVFTGAFTVDDFMSILQVFVDSLSGLNLYDDVYSTANQNLDTVNTLITSLITSNCNMLVNGLLGKNNSYSDAGDLFTRKLLMEPLPQRGVLDFIESVDTKQSQQSEINNTLHFAAKDYRMSKDVVRSSEGMRNVQGSQFGRMDTTESPESSKIGTVHSRTFLASINDMGFLTAPLMKVHNGEFLSDEPCYVTFEEEEHEYVAAWDETFHELDKDGNLVKKKKIRVRSPETFLEVPIEDVKYCSMSPFDDMSPSRMMLPFPQNSQAKRLLMGANQQRQAIPLLRAQRPLVGTGGESLLGAGFITVKKALTDYYESMVSPDTIPLEEFLKKSVKLKSIQTLRDFKILTLDILDFDGPPLQVEIPFMQKAASGSLFSYHVNTRTNQVYSGLDVIAHAMDINIDEHIIYEHADYGHLKIDRNMYKQGLSLSRNILVGFKTHEGSTIDDSVTISDDLVNMELMTTMDLHMITKELADIKVNSESGTMEVESFGYHHPTVPPHMQPNGVPIVGVHLKAGDLVIAAKVEEKNASQSDGFVFQGIQDKSVFLEGNEEGMVLYSSIDDGKAIVLIGTTKSIESGDKIAGRHGNKGVIARIVPRSQMPYDPKTGEPLQMLLNPLGIPSRINLSQLLEGALGMAMLRRGKGEICVITPYKSDSLDFVRGMCKENNVYPMKLRDGRTGKMFKRPINVAILYMLRLEHQASHKSKAVGLDSPLDPVFNQPSKGDGGQAFGEMESWCLETIGARKVMDDLHSIQSDDLEGIKDIRHAVAEDYREIEVEGENNNDVFFQVVTRCLGVEPEYTSDGTMVFKPLTDTYTKGLSPIPVDIYNKKSLESHEIFGVTSNSMSKFRNRHSWGWMPLKCEIVHPFFVVKGKLNRLIVVGEYDIPKPKKGETVPEVKDPKIKWDFAKESLFWDLIAEKAHLTELSRGRFVVTKNSKEGSITGMSSLVHLLRTADVQDAVDLINRSLEGAKSTNSIKEKKKHLYKVKSFIESGVKLSDFVVSTIPVMPLAFRPKPKLAHVTQDFDFYYSRIMDEVVKYSNASVKTEAGVYAIYMRVAEFAGLTYGKEIEKNKDYKPLIKYFTGREGPDSKHGGVREKMMKKRTLMSGRTPIIPSTDTSRPPIKIGIPFALAVKVWGLQLVYLLKDNLAHLELSNSVWEDLLGLIGENREQFNDLASSVLWDKLSPDELYTLMYNTIRAFLEGYTDPNTGEVIVEPMVVLAGRQPTLHQFNIRAFEPILVPGRCIQIHPVVCPLYNADFDGDQMWFQALINRSAMREAIELMSPEQGIVNPKDGSVIMSHTQDMRLGVYFATMLHDNVDSIEKDDRYQQDIRIYKSIDLLSADVDMGLLEPHDLVSLSYGGLRYLSTAGRILFNSLLPLDKGFTEEPFTNVLDIPNINVKDFRELRFDGLVSGNGGKRKSPTYVSLPEVSKFAYENYTSSDNLKFIQNVSEFGFKFSDISGITLSLEDFVEYESTQQHIDRAKIYAERINDSYFEGLISEQERKDELIYLYTQCKARIKKSFMAQFERNNNMFIIFDSGARGNEDQIIQSCGIIGILQKTKTESLEVPILSNYLRGVDSFEGLQLAYSTRLGVASTQNETAESGELSRLATYMSGGVKVIAADCGYKASDFRIWLGDPTGIVTDQKGNTLNTDQLIGKKIGNDPRALKYLKNYMDDSRTITANGLRILLKNKTQHIICEDGEYSIHHELDSLMNSMLLNRTAEGLKYLKDGKYITEQTLEWIKKNNLESIKVRTLLKCRCIKGVCQKCYGLMYDTEKLPPIGYNIGVTSSECISEPAAQLTLSLFHGAGEAGKSVDKGVELYKSFLKTGFSPKANAANLARYSGYVKLHSDSHRPVIVSEDGEKQEIHYVPGDLIVEDGEYVNKFTPLSQGMVLIKDPMENPSLEDYHEMQMSMVNAQFRIFESSNIDVFARHFELVARIQTSICTILNSQDPNFKEGSERFFFDVVENCNGECDVLVEAANSSTVILHHSGPEALLAHSDLAGNLGMFVSYGISSKDSSFLGKIMKGRSLSKDTPKIFVSPGYMHKQWEKVEGDFEEDKKVVSLLLQDNFVKELSTEEEEAPDIEIDWGDMFGDSAEFEQPEVEIKPEVEIETEVESEVAEEVAEELSLDEEDDLKNSDSFNSQYLDNSRSFGG